MKIDVPACLLFGFTGIAVLVTRPSSPTEPARDGVRAPSASNAAPIETGIVRSVELTEPQAPRAWFPPLAELLADPAINPGGVTLSAAATAAARDAFERASAELTDIDNQFSDAQAVIARQRVERGMAEPYDPARDDRSVGGDGTVVIAQLDDGARPWLVRISSEELPQKAAWEHEVITIREAAFAVLAQLLREATVGDAAR